MTGYDRHCSDNVSIGTEGGCNALDPLPKRSHAWDQALVRLNENTDAIALPKSGSLGLQAFPSATDIMAPKDPRKRVDYIHAWALLESALVARAGAGTGGASRSYQLLRVKWSRLLDLAKPSRLRQYRDLVDLYGDGVDLAIVRRVMQEPYVIEGQQFLANEGPSYSTLLDVLWRVEEIRFRADLLALDRLLRGVELTSAEEETRLGRMFDPRSYRVGNLLDVRHVCQCNVGLVADDWRVRLHYLVAFANIMHDWSMPMPASLVDRLSWSRDSVARLEHDLAFFFTQSLWEALGRVPSFPPCRALV
ncbi:hypothetical protein EV122DRAFT_284440 [Schizophyllum commune]